MRHLIPVVLRTSALCLLLVLSQAPAARAEAKVVTHRFDLARCEKDMKRVSTHALECDVRSSDTSAANSYVLRSDARVITGSDCKVGLTVDPAGYRVTVSAHQTAKPGYFSSEEGLKRCLRQVAGSEKLDQSELKVAILGR